MTSYKVKVGDGHPYVVDDKGKAVPDSCVHDVRFPKVLVPGKSDVYQIAGPGTANATIENELHENLPLC